MFSQWKATLGRSVFLFLAAECLLLAMPLAGPAATLQRGPYLQAGTPNSIVVRWRTGQSTDSRVWFGLSENDLTWTVHDSFPTTEHSLTLTNLAPDTQYFYAVAEGTNILAGGQDYFFTTSPVGAKPTRIWVLGDPGTASLGSPWPGLVRDAYSAFTGSRPTDVWLMLGDNAYLSGTDAEYQAAVFDVFPQFLRTTPLWPTIGNHETYAPLPGGRLPYEDIFTLPQDGHAGGVPSGTERYYSFDYGDIHFVCLDSELSANSAGSPMLTWLDQDLSATTGHWIIAYWHSPPYSKGSHDSDFESNLIEMRENVVPVLESYGVDLVLCGHSHSYERSYLLHGHYGDSTTLLPSMVEDSGSGRPEETGAYDNGAQLGTVYMVAGSSGQRSGGFLNHPAMFVSLNRIGSVVIDVETNRLDARFLRETGVVEDHFSIIKGDAPPSIISSPASQTVIVGNTVTFSVVAIGTRPLSYQWLLEGSAISGATNATLTLAAAQFSDAGHYKVSVSNPLGQTLSAEAVLTVVPVPPCAPAPAGLAAWWPLDGDGAEVVSGLGAVVIGNPTFGPGKVDQGMVLDGVDDQGDVAANSSLDVGTGGGLTIELWIKPASLDQPQPLVEWNNRQGSVGVQLWISLFPPTGSGAGSLFASLMDRNGVSRYLSSPPGVLQTDAWQHVALTYDRASGVARLYLNGTEMGQLNLGSLSLQTSYDLFFGRRVAVSGTNYRYTGGLDEISLFDRALSGAEIQAIANAGQSGKCKVAQPPRITAQPQSRVLFIGETVTFSVVAAGIGPFSYQWRFDEADIPNASQSSLTLSNLQESQTGNYTVVVGNAGGSVTSAVAALTVGAAPLCVPAPSGLAAWWPLDGNGAELVDNRAAVLVGGPTFSPAKVAQGMILDGADDQGEVPAHSSLDLGAGGGLTLELWIKPATLAEPQPLVEWNNRQGFVGVQLWISLVPPTGSGIGSLFASLVDRNGTPHYISSPPGVLQTDVWQHVALSYDRASGVTRLYLNGAAVANANFGSLALETSYDLFFGRRVAVSGTNYRYTGGLDEISLFERALSGTEIQAIVDAGAAGKCKLPQPPRITSQPQSRAVLVGDTVSFSVAAAGSPPLTYQWRFNGMDISNASEPSLTLNDVQPGQAGDYTVVVANAGGSVTSAVAVLTVNLPPPTVRVVSGNAAGGGQAGVPIQLLAQGNENALGFSLNFDTSLLTFSSVTLGAEAAAGTTLIVNDTQAAAGRVGLGVALTAGSAFSAGTQEIVVVRFTVAVLSNATLTPITFGDVPTRRQLSDQQAIGLPALFAAGTVSISAVDLEGDVAARPGGDRALTIIDWVQLGRFVAALDTVSSPGEFQRADCAPRATLGNGAISLTDYVQAGRYAVGLDPATPVGGPTSAGEGGGGFQPASSGRTLCLRNTSIAQGQTNVVPITLEASGNENALAFSTTFDPLKLSYVGITSGPGAAGASLTVNASQADAGRIGVVLALPPGVTLSAGTQQVALVQFTALATAPSTTPLAFSDQPVVRETSDSLARPLVTTYTSGTVSVTLPPGPALRLTRPGGSLFITWPSSATGFVLESTAGGLGTAWSPVPGIIDLGEQKLAIVPMTGPEKYFRLRKP